MNSELLKFHNSCKSEYNYLIDHFNIMFYGYGCKTDLLINFFPDAKIYDLNLYKLQDIVEDLVISIYHQPKKNVTIHDIDLKLSKSKKKLIMILLNFDFNLSDLKGLKNIKLVGTIENIDFTFDKDDLLDLNFILRDLTTFISYEENSLAIDIQASKIHTAKMVFESLPNKSKQIFKAILSSESRSINHIFEKVKIPLMITRKTILLDALKEFFDHKIIKLKDNDVITINLTKDEIKELSNQLYL